MRPNRWICVRRPEFWTLAMALGSLGALAGLGIAAEGAWQWRSAWVRDQWPVADGTVLYVQDRTDRVANGRPADSRAAAYAFTLGERRIVGEQQVAIPTLSFDYWLRENALERMRPGPCRVHYNPENPAESWIYEPPPAWEAVLFGLLFAGMAFSIAFAGWRMKRSLDPMSGEQKGLESLPREPPGPRRWEVGMLGLM